MIKAMTNPQGYKATRLIVVSNIISIELSVLHKLKAGDPAKDVEVSLNLDLLAQSF